MLNSNPPFFLCLNMSFAFTNFQPRQCNASYNWPFIVDWSLSGIITSKLVIRESESPQPAASSILISRMATSSVIIPYLIMSAVQVVFHTPVSIKEHPKINDWLTHVEKEMRVTLARLLEAAVKQMYSFRSGSIDNEQYMSWVDTYQVNTELIHS